MRSAALEEEGQKTLPRGPKGRSSSPVAGRAVLYQDFLDRVRRAEIKNGTALMLWFPGLAHFSSMIDEKVGEAAPSVFGKHDLNVLFDLVRILLIRKSESHGEPFDMGVHDDTGNIKDGAKHTIGRLSPYPRKFQKLIHGGRHFPSVKIDQALAAPFNGFGLVSVKARRPDILFEVCYWHLQKIFRLLVFLEQGLRYLIHLLVRALSRENGRDQELESTSILECRLFVCVERIKDVKNKIRSLFLLL